MTAPSLLSLGERLEQAKSAPKLRFSLYAGDGWVTAANEPTIRILCDLWNNRVEVAAALKARASMVGGE